MITELSELDQAHGEFSDLHKEVYGFRPRWDVSHWTLQDFDNEMARLRIELVEVRKQEEEAEQAAIVLLEKNITHLIGLGASDREAAIRWLDEAENANGDRQYLAYCLGVPYNYFQTQTPACVA